MTGQRPSIAVVVCTRDRPEMLAGLLPALVDASGQGAEVVVVDSASVGPETAQLVTGAGLRVIRSERPGLAVARNVGVAATSADVVVFTDDDCRPEPGWAVELAAVFADDRVGFATGQVRVGAGGGRPMSALVQEQSRRMRPGEDVDDMGHGANMAFRRAALDQIGGFDEWLGVGSPFPGSEDKDGFWRVLRHGWEGAFVPGSVIGHDAWRNERQALRTGYGYGLGLGAWAVKRARIDGISWIGELARASRQAWREAVRALRAGYKFGTVNFGIRGIAIWVGGLRARGYPVVDGRFSRR